MDPETRREPRRDPKKRLARTTRGSDSEPEPLRSSGRPSRYLAGNMNGDEPRSRIVRNEQGEIVEYRHDDGESYKVGDASYIQTQRSDVPYLITRITDIKVTKAGHAEFVTRPFHRLEDLPDQIYQKLKVDRQAECSGMPKLMDKLNDLEFSKRELFICDAEDIQRELVTRNQMRGLCKIKYFNTLDEAAREFNKNDDAFFYILGYNPQKRVIACQDKEQERVKQIHHWAAAERGQFNSAERNIIPAAVAYITPKDANSDEDVDSEYEQLTWKPGVADTDLVMYLRAARSMAAFAGMCDGGPTDACITATRDATTLNAIDVLQKSGGKVDLALERLCANPMPSIPQRMWCEEDIKAFVKGLSQYGKDFFYIAKEFLPHKETAELIEFYYLWKKTPEGLQVRPRYRRAPKRTMYNSKSTYPRECNNQNDQDEFSDDDLNSIDSQMSGNHICRNCYAAVSSDWHHGGKENQMLCAECRLFYKKYGIDRAIENRPETPPELRKIRERAQNEQKLEEQVEHVMDFNLNNTDEDSQPPTEIGLPKLPSTLPPGEQIHEEIKPEPKPESVIKPELKPETNIKEEDAKRKIPTESHAIDDEPQNKKHKQEIKQEPDKAPTATSVIATPEIKTEHKVSEPSRLVFPNAFPKVQTLATNVVQLGNNPIGQKPTGVNLHPKSIAPGKHAPLSLTSTSQSDKVPPAQIPIHPPSEVVHFVQSSSTPSRLPTSNAPPANRQNHRPPTSAPPTPSPLPKESGVISTRAILGQPRAGVEPAPRPEPDTDHPCGPFNIGPRSPPPIRTSKPFSANSNKSTVRFVRNWEYQDGNSCARTDLLFRRDDDDATPIIRRNPTSQPTPPRPVQPTQRTNHTEYQHHAIQRPERTRSTGSVGGSSRPPSSGPTRGPSRQSNQGQQQGRHQPIPTAQPTQFRPSMSTRPTISPGNIFPGGDLSGRQMGNPLMQGVNMSQASGLPQHLSQTAHAEQLYALQQTQVHSQLLEQHQRAQALQANLHLQSLQERERQILSGGGLNQNDLHLLHQQSRLHEESVRRAAVERQSQQLSLSLPGQSPMDQLSLRHSQSNTQNSLIMEQQRAHAQAAQAALASAQHEALMRAGNPFAGSPFANSQLLLDPRNAHAALSQVYRNHQPK